MKKPRKREQGVPEWVVTFGDLMSLLLTFFILLQMFSEMKRDHEYQRVVTAIKEAFGYSGGVGVLPTDDPPLKSILEQMELMALRNFENTQVSQNETPGMEGPQMRVTRIREGVVFTIGGPSSFDERSAEIKPAVTEQLRQLAVLLAGRRNKIVIRGHASAKYLPDGSPWADLDDLSFERARNVKDVLVECGLDDRVFRLEAVGTREPARPRAVDPAEAAENRRVEVILTERLVEEFDSDSESTSEDLARGGSIDV
ncbi:MAG: OmpA/MotB family protein [Planctomycetota bacterium]